jgi:hypothetical protein
MKILFSLKTRIYPKGEWFPNASTVDHSYCSSNKIHKVAVWSQMISMAISGDILILQSACSTIANRGRGLGIVTYMAIPFHSQTFTAHNLHRLLSWNFSACKANLGSDNNARTRSLRIEIDQLTRMCSQNNLNKFGKKLQKHFSNEMKIHFFIEDTHLPPKISNALAVTWSLVLQTRNLANKIEES